MATPVEEPPSAVQAALSRARARLRVLRARLSPWGAPLRPEELTRKQRLVPLFAGALAACAALDVVLVLRFAGLGFFLPESAVEWVVDHIPGSLEAGAIGLMGGYAKILGLAVAVIAFVLVYALAGLYYPRLERLVGSRLRLAALFAATPAAVTLLVVLPLFGEGLAGERAPGGAAAAIAATAVGSLTYAGVLDFAYREMSRSYPEGIDVTRRRLFVASAGAALLGSALFLAISSAVRNVGRLAFASLDALFANELTSTESFYVVSKNLSDPAVSPTSWSLAVDGLVDRPLALSRYELLTRPLRDEVVTLECVSNEVGGNLISSARWTGVPLADLLSEAGPQPTATWALFTCADDYTVGVPLLRAGGPGALLALNMNGEMLPREHGFPARVLVPGLYGMMNAKWVTRITLVDHEVQGYWQLKGWTNDGRIRTTAIIAVAPPSAVAGARVAVGGVAFAGDRPVTRVDVSVDGGATWAPASLRPPLSAYAWTLWSFEWTPAAPTVARVQARAWSLEGGVEVVQEGRRESPFPNGSSGFDNIEVRVTA